MEAAAGARAAALGVGADAWHSAPNLEARGGRTEKLEKVEKSFPDAVCATLTGMVRPSHAHEI